MITTAYGSAVLCGISLTKPSIPGKTICGSISKEPTIGRKIADEIGIDKEMIVYAMDAIQSPVSLFEPVYSEGGDTLYVMDQISDKKNLEENWVEDISLRDAMNRAWRA